MVGLFGEKSGKKNESFLPFSLAKKRMENSWGTRVFSPSPQSLILEENGTEKCMLLPFFFFLLLFYFLFLKHDFALLKKNDDSTIILCNRVTILYSYKLYIKHAWVPPLLFVKG